MEQWTYAQDRLKSRISQVSTFFKWMPTFWMWCWNVSHVPNQTRHADSDTVSPSISHILSFMFCWIVRRVWLPEYPSRSNRKCLSIFWVSFHDVFVLFFLNFFFDVNIIKSVYVTIKYWMSITILLLLFSLLWTVTATATTVVLVRLLVCFLLKSSWWGQITSNLKSLFTGHGHSYHKKNWTMRNKSAHHSLEWIYGEVLIVIQI